MSKGGSFCWPANFHTLIIFPCLTAVRYHYGCVIYGWDPVCKMDEGWIEQMGVDTLPDGRHQPFYNVLGDDGSTRYAAQGRKLATPVCGTSCTPGANCGMLRIQGHHLFDFWFDVLCLQGQYDLDVYSWNGKNEMTWILILFNSVTSNCQREIINQTLMRNHCSVTSSN